MTKRMLIMLGCVLALVAVLALGKFLQIRQMIANAPKPHPETVTTYKVTAAEWQPQLAAAGTVTAYRGVDVTSEIAGLVREIKFKSGQRVKKNDILFVLNDDADVAYLNSLQASAELAATVLNRDEAQLAVEGVSQAQVDSDKADLKNKRALVKQQEALVQKKTIRAPFDGRLGITAINPGQYINPGDKLVSLQMIDPIYVDFFIPQKQISQLSVGQALVVVSDAVPNVTFKGKVNAINPVIDINSRNVQVQATLENEKLQLLPGMFANVSLDVGEKNKVVTVPQTAITYNPYGSTVFIVKPNDKGAKGEATKEEASTGKDAKTGKDANGKPTMKVQQVFVTTGATRGDQVAILKGIEIGQEIVTSGQLKLKNGTEIVVDNSVLPSNDANPTPQEH